MTWNISEKQMQTLTTRTLKTVVLGFIFFLTACSQGPALQPMPEALEALNSDATTDVEITTVERWPDDANTYYVFTPVDITVNSGVIIYPGGNVDFRAYAPTAKAIAEEGYLVALLSAPEDLAILGIERGARIIDTYPDIESWSTAGHSLGGTVAAAFAYFNETLVDGVIIWDSYPFNLWSLKNRDIRAKTIYGTNGGNTTVEQFEASAKDLPPGSELVAIEGGVHTFFGYYGDGETLYHNEDPTDLTREEQQAILVAETVAFLDSL